MSVRILFFTTTLLSSIILGMGAFAQDTSLSPRVKSPTEKQNEKHSNNGGDKRTTSINFEDELVEGEVKKPELLYLLQKKQFNFKRLIKLRENFLPEMNRTSEEIGLGRGQN